MARIRGQLQTCAHSFHNPNKCERVREKSRQCLIQYCINTQKEQRRDRYIKTSVCPWHSDPHPCKPWHFEPSSDNEVLGILDPHPCKPWHSEPSSVNETSVNEVLGILDPHLCKPWHSEPSSDNATSVNEVLGTLTLTLASLGILDHRVLMKQVLMESLAFWTLTNVNKNGAGPN